jgi:hypothetical protein
MTFYDKNKLSKPTAIYQIFALRNPSTQKEWPGANAQSALNLERLS